MFCILFRGFYGYDHKMEQSAHAPCPMCDAPCPLPSVLCGHRSAVIYLLLLRWARILAIINPIPMGCISPDFNFLSVSTKARAGGESTCFLR